MLNRERLRLMKIPDKDGVTIQQKVEVLHRYKNGNYKIKGQRSITPGNWNRKRSMLIHHREVRSYIEYYNLEEDKYIDNVRSMKKDRKRGGDFFKLGLRGS